MVLSGSSTPKDIGRRLSDNSLRGRKRWTYPPILDISIVIRTVATSKTSLKALESVRGGQRIADQNPLTQKTSTRL